MFTKCWKILTSIKWWLYSQLYKKVPYLKPKKDTLLPPTLTKLQKRTTPFTSNTNLGDSQSGTCPWFRKASIAKSTARSNGPATAPRRNCAKAERRSIPRILGSLHFMVFSHVKSCDNSIWREVVIYRKLVLVFDNKRTGLVVFQMLNLNYSTLSSI